MEIKMDTSRCRHLRNVVDQYLVKEETMEVRLPESMPDIGRVLGSWGKVIFRSKEWRSGNMSVGGGIMAWVLYQPEDGSEVRSVEAWIPFQLRWDLPESRDDGFILVTPGLQGLDARSVSPRKLMLRANVGARGQAMQQTDAQISTADDVSEDVQLLKRSYPMKLPCEYGEKMVDISEELEGFHGDKILRYDVEPVITEQKIIASRLVFRGKLAVTVWYLAEGKVMRRQWDVPFSQFADLDQEYGTGTSAKIQLMMTDQEVDAADGKLLLKASFGVQYVICQRAMVEIVEDAYSTTHLSSLAKDMLYLPAELDERLETVTLEHSFHVESEQVVNAEFYPEPPQVRRSGMHGLIGIGGTCNVLYYDKNGQLQSVGARLRKEIELDMDEDVFLDITMKNVQIRPDAGQDTAVSVAVSLVISTVATNGHEMVTGITLTEEKPVDNGRPSLILRRFGPEGLWEMAKQTGATVDEILQINAITQEPEVGKLILIPIP